MPMWGVDVCVCVCVCVGNKLVLGGTVNTRKMCRRISKCPKEDFVSREFF